MAISIQRVLDKLDSYLDKNQYQAAERHLCYWLEEADALGDSRGAFAVLNEMVGLYRKMEKKPEGLAACDRLIKLTEEASLSDTVSAATAFLNIATAYKSFGMAEEAYTLYEQAREIYERSLDHTDQRLAGLYNNMALTLAALGRFREAEDLYEKALLILGAVVESECERAITYLNLADLIHEQSEDGKDEQRVEESVQCAADLMEQAWDRGARDGNYAFVAEKCAPVFSHYGFFVVANRMKERSEKIHRGDIEKIKINKL